jgi:glycosyltransferase involved in cell wall biosynthesis
MKISLVSPFYNEAAILEQSVGRLCEQMAHISDDYEVIIVNDGSTDGSKDVAEALKGRYDRLRVVSYSPNKGRGHALRQGLAVATGEIVLTAEIDSTWDEGVLARMVEALRANPKADMVIASPHLSGGGYKNVPAKRVLLSVVGNWIIRSGLTYSVTMNTGMTRGYRRARFMELPLHENGKEFHLEVVNKALAMGFTIIEVPAVIDWGQSVKKPGAPTRKSSSNIPRLIRTHLLFSTEVCPFRYLFPVAIAMLLLGGFFLAWAVVNLFTPDPSINVLLTGLLLCIFGIIIFGLGALGQQNRAITRELWRVQSRLDCSGRPMAGRE